MQTRHRDVFFATYGLGPWDCWLCKRPVEYSGLDVHHVDGNPQNNEPANLVPMHRGCHMLITNQGREKSAETRAKISAIHRGRKRSPEAVAKMAAALRGKPLSAEHKAKVSAFHRGRPKTVEHRAKMSMAARRRAKTAEGQAHFKRLGELSRSRQLSKARLARLDLFPES